MSNKSAYNVLGVWHATHLFLIWRVRARASAIARVSYPDMHLEFSQLFSEHFLSKVVNSLLSFI